jgi:hypothetical protein
LTHSNKFSEPSQTLIHAIAIDDQLPCHHATAASDDGEGNNPPERHQKMEHLQSQKQHTHIGTYSISAFQFKILASRHCKLMMVFFCCSHALSLSHISHRSLSSLPLVKNHKLFLPSRRR